MFKSLYSGVSGLSANLTELDVIGNNIANSNTIGFKSGRVTFNEMLTQTLKSASRPVAGGLGGTNPQQVGLGTQVGSIDSNFNQGNFQTTGRKTDLAIQGPGFFILSDGTSNVFTRAGIFGLDSENFLVNPTTGLKAQGVMADADGVIGNGPMADLFIDPDLVMPAEASETLEISGNLDADSDAIETILESSAFLVAAAGGDLLTALSGQHSGTMNLNVGDTIRVNGRLSGTPDTPITTETFTIAADSSYQDLVSWMNATMTSEGANVSFAIGADGDLQVTNNTGEDLQGMSLSSVGKALFNQNFLFPSPVSNGATESTASGGDAGEIRAYADATDLMTALYSAEGEELGIDLSGGPVTLAIDGAVGGNSITPASMMVTAATTLGNLMQEIQYAMGINSNPVAVDEEGQIVVRGEVGTASALGDISITEVGSNNTVLESAFSFHQTQQARDQQIFSMATTVYDSLGGEHTINFSFEKVAGLNEWIWTAEMDGNEEILSGGSGRARFGDDGAITNFSFDDNAGSLTFRPQAQGEEGAALVVLELDYGEIGALRGLTQFEGSASLRSLADGFQAGQLVDFDVDQSGVITGYFSNDTIRNIGRIGVATFSNPGGLMREANNTYRTSGNSGTAMETFAGQGNGITMVPGTLEASNVDLAKEFTRLVVAQRAFQANSRVITAADQVMQELVNLVR